MNDNPDEISKLYAARFSGAGAHRTAVWSALTAYFSRWIDERDVVLDLGAGYCEFINAVKASRKYALDLNPDTKSQAHADVTVLERSSTEPWPLEDEAVDVVFTSNFLEHLPDKSAVAATLLEARRVLKPGGLLIALGPNIRYLPGAYWDFFDHHVALTDVSLAELLSSRGFCVELRLPKFLPYTMSVGRQYPRWMVRAYLALPLVWRLLGKQFLIVARKGSTSASPRASG